MNRSPQAIPQIIRNAPASGSNEAVQGVRSYYLLDRLGVPVHLHQRPNPPSRRGRTDHSTPVQRHVREILLPYPYMLDPEHLGLTLDPLWTPVFAQLCADIDRVLGQDKRGFHWRQLMQEQGQPLWYWCLGSQLDLAVGISQHQGQHGVTLINPPGDPHNQLRMALNKLVTTAMVKAGQLVQATPAGKGQYHNGHINSHTNCHTNHLNSKGPSCA